MVWKYVLIRNDSSQVTEGRHASCRLGHLTLGPRTIHQERDQLPEALEIQEMGSSRLGIDLRSCFDATKAHCVRWHSTTDHGDEKQRALQASKVVRSFGLPSRMPLDARLANNRGES